MAEKKKRVFDRKVARRVLRYIRPQSPLLGLSLFFSLLSVALTLYVPILIGRAVDAVAGAGRVDFARLGKELSVFGLCIAGNAALQWITGVLNNRAAFRTVQSLRQDAFAHLHVLPLKYLCTPLVVCRPLAMQVMASRSAFRVPPSTSPGTRPAPRTADCGH